MDLRVTWLNSPCRPAAKNTQLYNKASCKLKNLQIKRILLWLNPTQHRQSLCSSSLLYLHLVNNRGRQLRTHKLVEIYGRLQGSFVHSLFIGLIILDVPRVDSFFFKMLGYGLRYRPQIQRTPSPKLRRQCINPAMASISVCFKSAIGALLSGRLG